jgi:phage tail sheath protein FI|tara:strand:- start:109 stop:456 length:348 start_codon:yes stop_codon:yes gene_type:complete
MSSLKRIIKEAVKEAIQEELKDILLEAVKTPKVITAAPSQPVRVEEQKVTPTQPQMTMEQKREAYKNVLGETDTLNFNSSQAQSFRPNPGMDMSNGQLPAGEVDMTQIMGLMNKK